LTPRLPLSPLPPALPARAPTPGVPRPLLVKKITTGGTFRFQHRLLFIAQSLTHHHIGLEETADGIWSIYFNTVLLAKLDEPDYIIRG
jgi:hypothetical protein